jgi:hypothetical protein
MLRWTVMAVSSFFMGALGIAASFFPHELLRMAGVSPAAELPLVVQLMGALYVAFALVNWMAKDSLIGGIYNRPLAAGNFLHFMMGALALGKGLTTERLTPVVWAAAIAYAVLAAGFTYILFTSPVLRDNQKSPDARLPEAGRSGQADAR